MNEIVLITPPDQLNNDAYSILLICPSNDHKNAVNNIMSDCQMYLNLYWYENHFDNIEWLISLIKKMDMIIVDVDNVNNDVGAFLSHIIAQPNTFYLTNNNITPYNLISKNRVYDFVWLENFVRGTNE